VAIGASSTVAAKYSVGGASITFSALQAVIANYYGTPQNCNAKAVIYADNAGSPGALLYTGTATAVPIDAGQTTLQFAFSSPVTLTAGTYWFGLIADGTAGSLWLCASAPTTGNYAAKSGTTYASPNNPFGTPSSTGAYLCDVYPLGSAPTFFDGGTKTTGLGHSWTGAVNASTSVERTAEEGSGSALLWGAGAGTPTVILQAVNGSGSALLWGAGAGTPSVVTQKVLGSGAALLNALAAELTMGHYAVGVSEDIAGFNGKTRVFNTQAPYDSDLTKLSVYLEDTAGSPPSHARAVVFGNGLTPCLAVSAKAEIPTSAGWVDFVFAAPLHLTAGTWYEAGLIFDANAASVAWYYDNVGSGGDSPVTSSSHDIDTIAVGDAW
jgi:hypothetical protein